MSTSPDEQADEDIYVSDCVKAPHYFNTSKSQISVLYESVYLHTCFHLKVKAK